MKIEEFIGKLSLKEQVEEFEKYIVYYTLTECKNNKAVTAKVLRMSRTTLVMKIQKWSKPK